jgi:NADH-quinone oxidoreductase subunit G
VLRRLAGDDPQVNEEWNCDKGRWAFTYVTQRDRITTPLVREEAGGMLAPASWSEALTIAARGLAAAHGRAGVLVGGRATYEDAYAYAKFARIALGTNDVDFRSRAHSPEEAGFLASHIAGRRLAVTYADLEGAPVVLLVGFEPEEESPIVFLRLRKAVRKKKLPVYAIGPWASRGLEKLSGHLLQAAPGTEPDFLDALRIGDALSGLDDSGLLAAELFRREGAVILLGERLATVPGAFSAAVRLADATGARLGWVPRRAGERGALEAGALPDLLPGGRPVIDPDARRQVAAAWGVAELPSFFGRDTEGILTAASAGKLSALLVGGVDPADLPDSPAALEAIKAVPFVISLELRSSAVTECADVVFPVAPVVEKAGTFLTWEGRERPFAATLRNAGAMPDLRVLNAIADEMDVHLGLPDAETARAELAGLGSWGGEYLASPDVGPWDLPRPGPGEAVLAGWRMLLDAGSLQDGEPNLAGTARPPLVRLSAVTAAEIGAAHGDPVTVSSHRGALTLPLAVTDLPDRVVWLPLNSPGCSVYRQLGASLGAVVRIRRAGRPGATTAGEVS